MADQILARDWIFQVNSLADGSGTWLDILGILSFELNLGENEEVSDDTTFESQGEHESTPVQRGATLGITGRYKLSSGGVRNPGQARIDTLIGLKGDTAVGKVRFRHTIQTTWVVWSTWATGPTIGGGHNDRTGWEVTLTKSGLATSAAV
ncbi:MAG: hypothetical protein LC778_10245 [Acidobacteria bacterium]|nr:hypothetical protein [Acidobacteriota bacterium]